MSPMPEPFTSQMRPLSAAPMVCFQPARPADFAISWNTTGPESTKLSSVAAVLCALIGPGVLADFAPSLGAVCARTTQRSAARINTQANDLRNCAKKVLPEMSTIGSLDSLPDATNSGKQIALPLWVALAPEPNSFYNHEESTRLRPGENQPQGHPHHAGCGEH